MAWTYSDWPSQTTLAARLTRLRLHYEEVADMIGREVSADGKAVSSNANQQYLDRLMTQLDKLEERVQLAGGDSGGGRVSQVRFRRA